MSKTSISIRLSSHFNHLAVGLFLVLPAIWSFVCPGIAQSKTAISDPTPIQLHHFRTYDTRDDVLIIGFPRSMAMDEQQRLFILDTALYKVHVWSSDGSFLKSLGGQGEGPGEFAFENGAGSLTIFDNHLLIIDESVARIHYFDLGTMEYLRTVPRPSNLSRLYFFTINGRLHAQNISSGRGVQEVLRLNDDLSLDQVLFSRPYEKYQWLDDGKYIMRPFANTLMPDTRNNHIVIAESHDNMIRVFDDEGRRITSFRVPVPQGDVNEDEKNYYRRFIRERGRSQQAVLRFPDKGVFFSKVMAFEEALLAFKAYPDSTRLNGMVYDSSYKPAGAFDCDLEELIVSGDGLKGELSTIRKAGDNLLLVSIDDEGSYQIDAYEVKLIKTKIR